MVVAFRQPGTSASAGRNAKALHAPLAQEWVQSFCNQQKLALLREAVVTDILAEIAEATKWANDLTDTSQKPLVVVVEPNKSIVAGFTAKPEGDSRILFKLPTTLDPWLPVRVHLLQDRQMADILWVIVRPSMPVQLFRTFGPLQLINRSVLVIADDTEATRELRQQSLQTIEAWQAVCRVAVLLGISQLHAERLIAKLSFKDESLRLAATAQQVLAARKDDRREAAITLNSISNLEPRQLAELLQSIEYEGKNYLAWIIKDHPQENWVDLLRDVVRYIRSH